jgi:hypothetical protein
MVSHHQKRECTIQINDTLIKGSNTLAKFAIEPPCDNTHDSGSGGSSITCLGYLGDATQV